MKEQADATSPGGRFEFAYIGDTHLQSTDLWGTAHLAAAVRFANERGVDFVIFGGDQVNDAADEDAVVAFLVHAECLHVPWYGVAGNHDLCNPGLGESPYLRLGGMQRFAFSHRSAFFIGLDSNCLRGDFGEACQQQEHDFFLGEMAGADPACTQRFLFMHSPLFRFHPTEEEDWGNMPNRHTLVALFREHGVTAVFTGHAHRDLEASWRGLHVSTTNGTGRVSESQPETSIRTVTVFADGWRAEDVRVDATPPTLPGAAGDGASSSRA